MDARLYILALTAFAVLYLAIGVWLAYTLLFTLIIIFAYLVLLYGKLPENYPYSIRDTSQTLMFTGATWTIFVFLAPKSPIPFIGDGLTYGNGYVPYSALILIGFVAALAFLVIYSFMRHEEGASSTPSSGEKPKQGVGA